MSTLAIRQKAAPWAAFDFIFFCRRGDEKR